MNKYVKTALELYDLGKIYDKDNYSGISVFMSLDKLKGRNLNDEEKIRVLKIIGEQREFISYINKPYTSFERFIRSYKYEEELVSDLLEFSEALNIKIDKKLLEKFENITPREKKARDKKDHNVYILVGPQCSQKTYYIQKIRKTPSMLISRDDYSLEVASFYGGKTFDDAMKLEDNETIFKQVQLLDKCHRDISRTYPYDIFVDDLNVKHDKRRWWVEKKRDTHNIEVVVILRALDTILKCAKERAKKENKTVLAKWIIRRVKQFQIPLKNDGFDSIKFIFAD